MIQSSLWDHTVLPPEITGKLKEIIKRVRLIQLARGLLATIGVAIACALVTMAVDAALAIYSDGIRLAISLAGLALTLFTAFIALVRPLADRITPVRMARIIETRHPELQERISSALELLALGGGEAKTGSNQLLQLLVTDARTDASSLSAEKEFKGSTMKPVAIAAGVFVAILLLLFAIKPRQTALLFARAVAPCARLGNLGAMRYTFTPGDIVIVEGEPVRFTLVAPGEDTTRAELCIERKGTPISIERMTKRFDLEGGDPTFELVLPSVTESFRYRMRIGKAITRPANIIAVPPPAHDELVCTLERPQYTGLGSTQLVDIAEMPLRAPAGTKAHLSTHLNRQMTSLLLLGEKRSVSPSGPQPSSNPEFTWTFTTNSAPRWAISLKDERGFTNIINWASYDVVPDYPADIRLTYPSGSSYTLPTYGHLKTVFEIRDDYGIDAVDLVMQPDNDKVPWVTGVQFEKTGRNLWTVSQEISLGEFMIGGAKKIRIWLEAKDNLPAYLGGPNLTRSRVIAVNLDNAERRSLADQVRIPERDSITNLLEQAAMRLEEAARKLAAATNAPSATEFEKAVEIAGEAAREAAEKAEEAQKTADEGLFAGVADQLQQVAEETMEKAGDSVEELSFSEEDEREQAIKEAIENMNKAAEEARAIVPEVLEKDAVLEKASALESLASQEAEQARKAKERQLTDAELEAWEAKQQDLVNKFGAMDENATPAPEDARKPLPAEPLQSATQPQPSSTQQPEAPATEGQKPDGKTSEEAKDKENRSAPIEAAKAAMKAAEEAKGKEKDEDLLQQARAAEAAARESRRAAAESGRAKSALEAIEKDKEALAEIAKAAEEAKAEAKDVADDAFQVKLEAVKREAEKIPPDVAKAAELAKKAGEIAALAEKLASNAQDAPSAEKLEALAQELAKEAEALENSSNPFLKQAAEMAKTVAEAAKETAWSDKKDPSKQDAQPFGSEENGTDDLDEPESQVASHGADPANENMANGKTENDNQKHAGENGHQGQDMPGNGKDEPSEVKSEIAKAAEAVAKAAENAAKSTREQASDAIAQADAAAVAATNLATRLDAAFKPDSTEGLPKEGPASSPEAKSSSDNIPTPLDKSPAEKKLEELKKLSDEAKSLAEDAHEAAKVAAAAEKNARSEGANLAANAAQKAKQTAENAEKSAKATQEAAEKAAEALMASESNGPAEGQDAAKPQDNAQFKPPQESINKQAEAKRMADEATRRSDENKASAEKLAEAPAEHAAKAAEAAERAAELSNALAENLAGKKTGMQSEESAKDAKGGVTPESVGMPSQDDDAKNGTDSNDGNQKYRDVKEMTPEELREELNKATAEARREAQAATETANDTKENLPVESANAARQAADRADSVGRTYDAANAQPQPGQQPPNKEQLAQQAGTLAKQAEDASEKASRMAERAAEDPTDQLDKMEVNRDENNASLDDIAEGIIEAAKSIQEATPIASTNAIAAETIAGAKRSLEQSMEEAAKTRGDIQQMLGELKPVTANADRVARTERAALDKRYPDAKDKPESTPSELAAKEARMMDKSLNEESRLAQELENAARQAATNPQAAIANASRVKDELAKRMAENEGKVRKGPPSEDRDASDPKSSPADSANWKSISESSTMKRATGETRDLAKRLSEAGELVSDARDAFDVGDAEQAHEVAKEAMESIDDIAKRASESESARKSSAEKAMQNSKASSQKAAGAAEKLLNNSSKARQDAEKIKTDNAEADAKAIADATAKADSISAIASNVVAAAELSSDAPAEALKLADKALGDAMKLQMPSMEQLEAAKQANLAAQEFKRLAAETAELAGLDPETMKIKKPENYKGQKEKEKDPNLKKKPARTKIEGGGGADEKHDDEEFKEEEYEDGISLEMPEWLKRLGFPRAEWLKYKGSLESGLPDSALEHVPQEYRALVREYFKLLSTEK